ncbi:hypothetical protein [Methylobacterium sp. J-090]|uniref:hypothetical protein n=1 Tax=Methylobacterium sp. J-090 TaxID=2836666 RepID=UPI001FBB2BD9|nr:hypothetical protein [Methylobacterium sp. J-090]MCJ2082764.1 hypothetical protein [Methylobacterium sp. J-090]
MSDLSASRLSDPTLVALMADLADAHERLRLYLASCERLPDGARGDDMAWPENPGHPSLMSVREAAERAGRDDDTIRRWCVADGIGKQYGSRWRVCIRRLAAKIG